MDIAMVVMLILAAVVVSVYDTSEVQRTYADLFVQRHGHIPPLADWFFRADADAEVESWRRMHRNLWLLAGGLGIAAIIILIVRPVEPGLDRMREGDRCCVTGRRGIASSGDCRDALFEAPRPQRGYAAGLGEEVPAGSVTDRSMGPSARRTRCSPA